MSYGKGTYGSKQYHAFAAGSAAPPPPPTDLRLDRLSVEAGRTGVAADFRLARLSVEAGRTGVAADFRLARLSVEVVVKVPPGGPVWAWSTTTSAAWHII